MVHNYITKQNTCALVSLSQLHAWGKTVLLQLDSVVYVKY